MPQSIKLSRFWLVLTIAQLSMIGPFTVDTYLPAFPAIESDFGVSRALLNQSLGFYLAAYAISTLVWGPITDRFGRRPIIILGMVLYAVSSLGCAFSSSYAEFLGYRVMQGIVASGGLVAGRAIVRDLFDSRDAQKVMSQVIMLFAIAPAIAPIVGGWLHDHWGWRSIFYFLAIYGLLSMLAFVFFIPESHPRENRQSLHPSNIARVYLSTFKHAHFQAIIFAIGTAFAGLFLYIAGAPTVIFNFLGLGADDFGWQFIPMVVGIVIGSYASSRLAHRLSREKVVSLSLSVLVLSVTLNLLMALWLPVSIFTVIFPLLLYALGIGLFLPAMTVLALDCFPQNRGTASALQGFIQMIFNAAIASIILPLLGLYLHGFVFTQLIFVVLTLGLWLFIRKGKTISEA